MNGEKRQAVAVQQETHQQAMHLQEQTAAHQTTVQQTVLYLRSEASDRQPVMQQFTETQL